MTKTAPLPHQVNPAVPPEVSQVIARAIARDRDDRYGSAMDLREELRRVSRTLSSSVTGPISTSTLLTDRTILRRAWPIVLLVVASWAVLLGLWWPKLTSPAPANPYRSSRCCHSPTTARRTTCRLPPGCATC